MRALLIGSAALLASAGAASAQTIEIENAVARVTVITEARSDIQVDVVQGSAALPPVKVTRRGDTTFIDGGLRSRDIRGCTERSTASGEQITVEVNGVGRIPLQTAPRIVIRAPLSVEVESDGAVWGTVGRTDALELSNAGCGDWTVANVRGELEINVAGSGDVRAGTAGSADIDVAGSGDVSLVSAANGLEIAVAGSGDVRVGSSAGQFEARVAGSGDVIVNGGRADRARVSIAGSGDVRFAGVANSLSAQVAGSGDVRFAQVTGDISRSVVGSGAVIVGN